MVSVGVSPNPLIPNSLPQLEVTKWGTISVNEENLQSSIPEMFAGGDIVRGGVITSYSIHYTKLYDGGSPPLASIVREPASNR